MSKGGPKTSTGKAIAAQNATTHGVLSRVAVVPGLEREDEWEAHRAGVFQSLSACGQLESVLAERVALLLWRLQRVTRYETESIALAQEAVPEDVASDRRFAGIQRLEKPFYLEDAEGQIEYHQGNLRLLKRFPKLPAEATISGEDAGMILVGMEKRAEEVDLAEISVPGIPDDVGWEDMEPVTVGAVRLAMQRIGEAAERDPAELYDLVLYHEECDLRGARMELEKMEGELDRKRRERLLPKAETLEKVSRYEAHLSRELTRALKQLEELQDRRQAQLEAIPPREIVMAMVAELMAPDALPEERAMAVLPAARNCETNPGVREEEAAREER
jgi:hypothetical protein